MRKLIISSLLLASTIMFADTQVALSQESKLFKIEKIKDDVAKGMLFALEHSLPTIAVVMKDYLGAKLCNEEFYADIPGEKLQRELQAAGASVQWGTLMELKYKGKPQSEYEYKRLIDTYKYMNCGIGSIKQYLVNQKGDSK